MPYTLSPVCKFKEGGHAHTAHTQTDALLDQVSPSFTAPVGLGGYDRLEGQGGQTVGLRAQRILSIPPGSSLPGNLLSTGCL